MSEYFDQVERDLYAAVQRRAHLPWFVRMRLALPRGLVVVIVGLAIAGPAYAAVRLIDSGSPVPASSPVTPHAFNGAAITTGVRMLAVRTPDPAGGLSWGMRTIATTRGVVCIQVGRVAYATLGAVGVDNAFHDDGRFHPFSPNYQPGPPCATPDGRGNVFLNVAEYGIPASALMQAGGVEGGCAAPNPGPPRHVLARRHLARPRPTGPGVCPVRDLRNVFYGFLGPDAVSITYNAGAGRLSTSTLTGPDGEYLLVFRGGLSAQNDGFTYDAGLFPGSITAVHYRDGHTCRIPPAGLLTSPAGRECPPVGYAPTQVALPTPGEVSTRVTAELEPSRYYCDRPAGDEVVPCPGRVPMGFQRMDMSRGPASVLVVVSFTSPVAITNGHSYYYIEMSRAPYPDPRYKSSAEECGSGAADGGQSNDDYAKGQLVKQWFLESLSCRGPVHGNVTLVITTGPSAPGPMPAVQGQSVGREVGHFNFVVP